MYQIDGAKVGFPPLMLRIFICQSEVLVLINVEKVRIKIIKRLDKLRYYVIVLNNEVVYGGLRKRLLQKKRRIYLNSKYN